MKKDKDSKVVCVLGMHRSGTSMINKILSICGLYIGPRKDLLEPNKGNSKGHFENKEILRINDEILKRFKGSWDNPPIFPKNWENSNKISDLKEEADNFFQLMNKKSRFWGFKEPRTCLTLPFWKKIIPDMLFIIPKRNPMEVALSLKERDSLEIEDGLLLWSKYWLEISKHTKKERKIITVWSNYFSDWEKELKKIVNFIGEPYIDYRGKENKIENFISPKLRHQQISKDKILQNPKAKNLLSSLVEDFIGIIEEENQILSKKREQIRCYKNKINSLKQFARNRESKISDLTRSIETIKDNLDKKNTELDKKNTKMEKIDNQLRKLAKENSDLENKINFMKSSKFWRLRNKYIKLKSHVSLKKRKSCND